MIPLKKKSPAACIRTVDLFCGCGGMSMGFQLAGFEILAAYDHWKPAIDVYSRNFEHKAEVMDLATPLAALKVREAQPDLVIGGPPCQDFSSAGPNNRTSGRAELFDRFVDFVESCQPRCFVIENVPRARLSPVFKRARKRLQQLGYGLTEEILDAAYCGVPQTRKRLFLIGHIGSEHGFLSDSLRAGQSAKPMSMRDYFGSDLGTDYYFRVPTNYSRRGVFSIDQPSATIRAVDRPIPRGYPGHADDPVPIGKQVRALTVSERARIQTFPREFEFVGSNTDMNKMIGNAVPVKLAEFVARSLMQYLRHL